MEFQLTRKYLEDQISDSVIALQKHKEGVRVHEIVIEGFEKELSKLPPAPKPEIQKAKPAEIIQCVHKFVFWKHIDNHMHNDFIGKEGQTNFIFFCEKCLKQEVKVV